MARPGRSYAAVAIVNRFRGETTLPTYSVAPAVSVVTDVAVTFTATATDDLLGPLDHYVGIATAGSTPSAAQVVAGTGGGILSGKTAFAAAVASGGVATLGSIGTLSNNGHPFTAAFTARDSYGNLASVTYLNFWTTIGQATRGELTVTGFAGALSIPRTVTVPYPLALRDGTVRSNLTNLHWSWFDEDDAGTLTSPTDFGIAETTDSSGNLAIPLVYSALTSGQYGRLCFETADKASTAMFRIALP